MAIDELKQTHTSEVVWEWKPLLSVTSFPTTSSSGIESRIPRLKFFLFGLTSIFFVNVTGDPEQHPAI